MISAHLIFMNYFIAKRFRRLITSQQAPPFKKAMFIFANRVCESFQNINNGTASPVTCSTVGPIKTECLWQSFSDGCGVSSATGGVLAGARHGSVTAVVLLAWSGIINLLLSLPIKGLIGKKMGLIEREVVAK